MIPAQIRFPQTSRSQIILASLALLSCLGSWFFGILPIFPAALPIAFLLIAAYPAIWSIIFMALAQYRIPDAFQFLLPLHLPLGFACLSVASLIWHVALARNFRAIWRLELRILVLLLFLALTSLVFAVDRPASWFFLSTIYWKIIIASFALAWLLRTEKDLKMTAFAILISGLLIGMVAIYNKIYSIDLVEETRVTIGRAIESPLGDPNDLALVLLTPFFLSLAMLIYRPARAVMVLSAVTAVITMLAIVATQSRGGLLAVVAGIGVIGLHLIRSRTALIAVCAVSAIVLAVAMGLGARKSGGIEELSRSNGLDHSSYLRLLIWSAAIKMAIENPYAGVGIAGFGPSFYFYTPVWVNRDHTPHSTWFGMMAEMGFPGFIALVVMLGSAIISTQQTYQLLEKHGASRFVRGMAFGIKCSLISSCVSGTFLGQHTTWPIYMLVAISVALRIYAEAVTSSHVAAEPDPALPSGAKRQGVQ